MSSQGVEPSSHGAADHGSSTSSTSGTSRSSTTTSGTTTTSSTGGVQPFDLVRGDLKDLKLQIKQLVERHVGSNDKTREGSTNPLLQEAAREFFERRERAWRPGTVLLMARALAGTEQPKGSLEAKQLQLAEIVEMMATAQVIHDDVLEDFDQEEKGNAAHRMYSSELGNKVSLLAGDFLLARSSVALAQLTNVDVVEIIGTSLENMCRGEIMQAWAKEEDKVDPDYYLRMVTMKTASLVADACRCTAILRGDGKDSPTAAAAWDFGHNLGVAYCYAADAVAFENLLFAAAGRLQGGGKNANNKNNNNPEEAVSSEILAALAKQSPEFVDEALEKASAFGQPASGAGALGAAAAAGLSPRDLLVMMTALPPYGLAAREHPLLIDMAVRGFEETGDVDEVGLANLLLFLGVCVLFRRGLRSLIPPPPSFSFILVIYQAMKLLQESDGVANTVACSKKHGEAARAAAALLPPSRYQEGLLAMCELVVEDEQRGLQREAYVEQQAKKKAELRAKLMAKGLMR